MCAQEQWKNLRASELWSERINEGLCVCVCVCVVVVVQVLKASIDGNKMLPTWERPLGPYTTP